MSQLFRVLSHHGWVRSSLVVSTSRVFPNWLLHGYPMGHVDSIQGFWCWHHVTWLDFCGAVMQYSMETSEAKSSLENNLGDFMRIFPWNLYLASLWRQCIRGLRTTSSLYIRVWLDSCEIFMYPLMEHRTCWPRRGVEVIRWYSLEVIVSVF